MSLLSIGQDICDDIGLAAPTSIVGSTDQTALRLLSTLNRAGQYISRRPQGGWTIMIKEYDFNTAAIDDINGTATNSGNNCVITGLTLNNMVQPNTWWAFGNGLLNDSIVIAVTNDDPNSSVTLNYASLQPGPGVFTFGQSDYPLPSDFERPVDSTMWDRTRFWSMRGPQSPQQWQLYKSSVIGRASIQRRFRIRNVNGVDYFSVDPVPTDNDSQLVFEYVSSSWCQSSAGVPQDQWMADTDTGIIDEYLITLDGRWRMLRRLGLSYQEEKAEAERMINKAIYSDGAAAILDLTPPDQLTLIGPWNLPETNFGNMNGS